MLPHSFHAHDTEANDYQFLLPFMKDAVQITHSMQETYDVYAKKKIDICIAGRFHAGVLAKVYKIPHVILSYAKKTESL
ncbi:MAG: hypothetical protein H6767_04820 [Candidatus Peribacteria bacterium]|nr:MAG: hypothetical protein H6767_04820 [Candidatus Peribacteria bacterium]